MKKIISFLLAGTMVLVGLQMAIASDDHYEKNRSEIYGTVDQMPKELIGIWIINGRTVEVTSRTQIEQEYGKIKVGSLVEVEGRTDGNVFHATELEGKHPSYGEKDRYTFHKSEKNDHHSEVTHKSGS